MVGFMPDFLPTHRDITVDDYLDFYARAFHIRHDRRRTVIDEIEQFTNLVGIRHKFLDALSKGMKQRLSLARALIHDPQVLILDEPAAGLDPRARIELRELLKALREQSKAVLVSSHILAELAEICDSVVVIEKGKVLTSGRLNEITTKNVPHRTVKIRSLSPNGQLKKKLLEIPRVLKARDVGDGVEVDIEGTEQDLSNLVTRLVNEGIPLVEVRHMSSGLESIFMNITKGELA
jgi:ABC-2 type transport system ATP-binding protein